MSKSRSVTTVIGFTSKGLTSSSTLLKYTYIKGKAINVEFNADIFIMSEETKKALHDILTKVPGLYCILITDREGVPVVKVCTEKAPEAAMRFGFISTFGLAVDQGSKLGLGRTSTLICYYSQFQVIQMNKLPLVLTFIASNCCNTGHIMALENPLESLISELSLVVAET